MLLLGEKKGVIYILCTYINAPVYFREFSGRIKKKLLTVTASGGGTKKEFRMRGTFPFVYNL